MKLIRILILTILLCFGLFYFTKQDIPVNEKSIFHSEVFEEYFKAQKYPLSPNRIEMNRKFIEEIRRDLNPNAVKKMFTGSDLTNSYEQFIFRFIPRYHSGDYFSYLKKSLARLKENKKFKKSKTTLTSDSYSEGNLPFLQFILPNGTKVIRMGLPITETSYFKSLILSPTVNPEFLTFIQSQHLHLYVNLMKREGLEGPNSKALEALELKERSLAVVTLDKNSDFYWQEGNFPAEAQTFKQLFYEKLLDPMGNYYWPCSWKGFEKKLSSILEETHANYFNGDEQLSVKDRQDFIELAYLKILEHLVLEFNPNSMNITCKHAIDRGPSLAVLWQWKLGLANENEVTALLLAPPLLMHNRTSHESRLDRFISAASFFYPKKKGEDRIEL